VARGLIVGCGCRGRLLGKRLLDEGWAVRGTSRREEGLEAIAAAGIEPASADPTVPGSVLDLVGDVTAVLWLLGSARGSAEELSVLHGRALERLLERIVETPVRGFLYEAEGAVDPDALQRGGAIVQAAGERLRSSPPTPAIRPPGSRMRSPPSRAGSAACRRMDPVSPLPDRLGRSAGR
jgi:uncharacterized protein YbjT (DUF2867 family)